jgi:hypothetical protein
MARTPTSADEAAPGAGTAEAAVSHALSTEKALLMDKVTRRPGQPRPAARRPSDATASVPPRLLEEAVRVFLALGITAADLRLRARPGSALATLAEAMESPAGAR